MHTIPGVCNVIIDVLLLYIYSFQGNKQASILYKSKAPSYLFIFNKVFTADSPENGF